MRLLFIFPFLLNFNCKGFEVFDCSLNPQLIKSWDLTSIRQCKNPESQFEKETTVKVQVFKNEEKRYQTVWKCELFQTVTATKCGYSWLFMVNSSQTVTAHNPLTAQHWFSYLSISFI